MHSQKPQTPWTRYTGMGFEFAASLAVFMLVGYWVDYHWQIQNHWGLLIGTILGVIGGTYNFVRGAIRAMRGVNWQANRPRRPSPGSGAEGPGGAAEDPDRRRQDEAD